MKHFTALQTRAMPALTSREGRCLVLLLLVCLFAAACASLASATVLDPRTVQSATLENGLRLVVCEDPDSSVLSLEVIIRVGSADDPPGAEGMTHLLEHVLWAGAESEATRRRIEEMGGLVNAGVLRDFTRFYLTLPAGEMRLAVEASSALVRAAEFTAGELLRQCAIIEEESRGRLDQPRAVLDDLAFEELYGTDHPYGHPTDGHADALRTVGPARLSLFYQTWYVPNNMAVIVAGDVSFEDVRSLIESEFGPLAPAPLPRRSWPLPERPQGPRETTVRWPLDQAYVMAVFVGPAAAERRHVCTSDLIAVLLAHGSSGRLVIELKEKQQVATQVGVAFLTQRDPALFGVWAACKPENVPAVKDGISTELRRLAQGSISAGELSAARRLIAAGFAFANETPADRVATLGFYEAIDTYRSASQYLPRVRLLTSADVAEVAAWYAVEPVWVILAPKGNAQ